MKLRILSENDVRSVLTMADAIDVQATAFTALANGESIEGLRSFAQSETPPGVVIFNPSFLRDGKGYGLKVVSDFYENENHAVPRMNAIAVLFNGTTGQPRTVMEAGYLTDVRTGAGTALAARYLARSDSETVAVIGAGRVARNQLEALCQELPIKRVVLASRSKPRTDAFVERMAGFGYPVPGDIRVVDDRAEAVAGADIVVCATTSHEPVFPGIALSPGTFVVGAGAYDVHMREVDSETIRRATRLVIDSRTDCLDDSGDLLIPIQEGLISRDSIAELSELVSGKIKGRTSDEEITFYKSMGVPIQDLITAQFVETRANERGIGTEVDIGGDQD